MTTIRYESTLPVSASDLFEFHVDAGNLPVITPPFPPFKLLTAPGRSQAGDRQAFRLGWSRAGTTWDALISRVVDGRMVEDIQVRGPFRSWRHRHEFRDLPGGGAVLADTVQFRLLPTPVGKFLEFYAVRPFIFGLFRYRHRKTREFLSHHKSS